MEWRKIVNSAVLAFACTAVLLGGCSSSGVNVVTITVSPAADTVIAGQVQTFTATVSGSTTTTVTNWPCTYSYTPLPTASNQNPAAVTGTCTSGQTMNGGSIGTWVITTTNGSNVLTFTAPTLANFPSPPPTLTFTATADADTKKTATAIVTLDSGIRGSLSPLSVTIPVGLTPPATEAFTASLENAPALGLSWNLVQPNPSDTKNTNNDTANPLAVTCSPTCGTMDAGNNGIYTAPAVLPTATTPAGSTTVSPTTVYLVMWKSIDPLHYAVATITLVSATNNSINFTGIFPSTVAAGSTYANIYLNAQNLLNSTQIFFIPPGQTQGLPIVSTNIFTIPISLEYCTASASGVTPVVTCGASIMTRIELTSTQLAVPGTAQIEITGIPGSEAAISPCTNVPNADGSTTTSNISCPLTIAYASPALVAVSPDSFPQGQNANIIVDGGYFGGTNSPIVQLLLDGSASSSYPSSGPRQIIGNPQGSTLQNPGLYEVTIASTAPQGSQPPFPTATTNVAVQPTFSNFTPNPLGVPCPGAPAPQSSYPPCFSLGAANALPSSIALDSTKGFAVLTEQGTNALQLIDLTGSVPVPTVNLTMTTGSSPTSVALDNQINIPGYSGQDLGVVVSSGDSKLYLYAISRTNITPIGSIPVDLNSLLQQTAATQPTPYAVGVDPGTHLAALAYENTNIGFIVDVNPNLDGSDTHTCFSNSSVQTPPCVLAPVSMVTGSTPQVVMEPGAPVAYVTPGGAGSDSVVDLLQQGVSAQIAPGGTTTTSGAVRTDGIVKIITLTPHGINPALGGTVIIAGLLPADLNGTYQVIPGSVIDAWTFSYAQPQYSSSADNEDNTNTASNPGTVHYGTPYYSFNVTPNVTGAAINPTTGTLAFADPNASSAQITFIGTQDEAVTSSVTLTAGSCIGCTPTPAGAPELGFRSISFDPFTNVLVAYDPNTLSGPSNPGNAISLINPGSAALTGTGTAPYRIIAAIPTGQVGSGSYTPAAQTTAVTVNGPMIYDPKSRYVLAANAGSNTVSYMNLDPGNLFKKVYVQTLQVTSPSAAVPNSQPALGSAPAASCDPTSAINSCMPQAVQLGQTATLQINGEGFLSGGGTPVVRLDGSSTGVTIVQDATHVLTDSQINVSIDASVFTVAHDFALDVVAGNVVSNSIDLHAVGVLNLAPVCAPTATFPQGPEGVAIDDSLHVAFVTNYACNSVSLITINPQGFVKSDKTVAPYGSVLTTVTVGNNPLGVAVIPRLGYAVVANSGDTPNGTASIINYNHSGTTADMAYVVPITVTSSSTTTTTNSVAVGLAPRGVAIDQDRALALVANSGSNTLSSIDLTVLLPGAVTTTVPVATTVALSGPPTAIAISPDEAIAAVTNLQNTGTSSASAGIDVVTLSGSVPARSTTASVASLTASLTGIVFDPAPAFNPTPSDAVFYATSTQQNAVYSFDPNTGSANPVRVGFNPYSLGYNYQTGTLLTINSTSNTSSIVDVQNLKTRQTLGITSQSQFAVAVDNWFNSAVIADQNNNRVLLLALPK